MDDVRGRTAVVTGGGSGIGRGLVLALAEAGTNVVVADIEEEAARSVAKEAEQRGVTAVAAWADVAEYDSMVKLADVAYGELGAVHILCNNAGVFIMGPTLDMIPDDWHWVFSVNVMGVVHGIHAFLPRMLDQGEPIHIVNTSSVAGLGGGAGSPIYSASKTAVTAISESLHAELSERDVGVSVLCPANISSRILDAQRNRPAAFGRKAAEPLGTDITDFGLDPIHVGRRAVAAIRTDALYVFVFPTGWEQHLKPGAQSRYDALLAAIDRGGVSEE